MIASSTRAYAPRPISEPAGTLRDFHKDFGEPIRQIHHHVVTARQLVDQPCLFRLETLLITVERYARVTLGADVGLLGYMVARTGDGDLVGERRQRMRRAHGIDPAAIFLIDSEHRGRDRL